MYSGKIKVIEIPLSSPKLKEFVKFSWKLYKDDPCWTPPLNGDLLGNRLLGLQGLLTSQHPYHRHAEVTHFMAFRDGQAVGRISAAINHQFNEYHKTSIGSFGFFEVINDYEVARVLLDHVRQWVIARGMTVLRGPGEYSNATHERQGILIEGFRYEPTFDLTHNPPYYAGLLEKYGFQKSKDYLAYIFNRDNTKFVLIKRLAQKVSKDIELTTRPAVMKNLKEEIRLIVQIYNAAWSQNWGFLPIPKEEADSIADSLSLIIDPNLVRFGFIAGEPAAVIGFIPDPNYALRPRWKWYGDSDFVRIARLLLMRRHIPRTRGMFFGVKPEYRSLGIPAILTKELLDYMLPQHYQESDGSLILEDNEGIIKVLEIFGGQPYKRWRIYDLPLY
jgi:GNAT superfamily N-acetyltransferase